MVLQVPEPIPSAPFAALPTAGVAYEGEWDGYRCLLARHPDGRVEIAIAPPGSNACNGASWLWARPGCN
ncbi:hypothetical protein [Streptomyces sp. NPDC015125]|uniref:hypothetical protein n=1 Tax=Streptomyces sp. NPDC015125 TaxID=3364938 RepID=UPI0036F7988E